MSDSTAIFRREVTARRDLLVLAAAVLMIVLVMPLVPGTSNYSPGEVRSLASRALAMFLGWGVAIGLGLSVFGSDLSAGRLGFFFARPVTARAIWTGRILAALAIVLTCEFIVVLPALIEEGARIPQVNSEGWLAVFRHFVLVPVLLFFLSHALSIMIRARSAWLLLDLLGLIAVAVGSWLVIRPLHAMGAELAVMAVGLMLALSVVAALVAAGWAGLAAGRTDLRRTHGALSVVLWFLLGAAVTGLALFGGWLTAFGPAEMNDVEVLSVSPDGGWIEVWGGAPRHLDVRRRVLMSSGGSGYLELPVSRNAYSSKLVYSADGKTAVAVNVDARSGDLGSLWWVDLSTEVPTTEETHLVVPHRTVPAISPDGSRIALLEGGTLSVYDLASEQLVTAAHLPTTYQSATVLFFERDRLRLLAQSRGDEASTARIAEFDLGTQGFEETGRVEGAGKWSWVALNANADRMVVSDHEDGTPGGRLSLRDARDGSLIRRLHGRGPLHFLRDGRLAFLTGDQKDARQLVVESVDGLTRTEYPVGDAVWLELGGEALPGQLVVGSLRSLDERLQGRSYQLVDVDSGAILPIGDGFRRNHQGSRWVWGNGGAILWYVDRPASNRIFTDHTGAVVRWDPATGELVDIVGGQRD